MDGLRRKPELLLLSAPLSWKLSEARDADTTRQPSIDCGLNELRCKKGESYRPVHLAGAAFLARGNLFDVFDCAGN